MTLGLCFCFIRIAIYTNAAIVDHHGLGNTQSGQVQTVNRNNGLSAEFSGQTCHKQVFSDPRCFTVTYHQRVSVMQCSPGTYFDNRTCNCDLRTDSLSHDLPPVHCQQLHSQLSASAHTAHHNTLSCTSDAYTYLEQVKTQQHCYTSDALWSRLGDVSVHDSIDCVKKIVAEMKNYYASWNQANGHTPCTCHGVKKYIKWPTDDTSHCYTYDSNFRHMYNTVFGSRNTYSANKFGRRCASHNTMWAYVDAVSKAHTSNACLEQLIRIMIQAFYHLDSGSSCHSCALTDHTVTTTTPQPALHNDHDYCMMYTAYADIHNLIEHDQCVSDQAAFQKLNQLIRGSRTTTRCAEQLVTKMYAVYGRMAVTPGNCSCSAPVHSEAFNTLPRCAHIPIYTVITGRYTGTHTDHQGGSTAPCNSHHTIWNSLNSLQRTDPSCLHDAISKIASARHTEVCSCYTDSVTTTPAPHNTHIHSTQCQEYSGYKELMGLISTDMCVSYTRVWGALKILGTQRHDCLVGAIKHLADTYHHFDNGTCSCSHSGTDDLVFHNIHAGHYPDCWNHFQTTYKVIMNAVLGHPITSPGHQGYCWTHQTLWSKLSLLATTTNRSYCLMDLINYLAASTESHTDTCSCHPVQVTTAAHTVHPTSHPTAHPTQAPLNVQPCQKLDTLIALAHNAYLVDNAAPCPSGGHSQAEATVVDLCHAPESISWRRGYNVFEKELFTWHYGVLHHCQHIPQYTAVASFAGNLYNGDGVSGILVACNSTSLKVATQRCDHPMEVVTILSGVRDTYTHMAENYYTIQW